MNCRKCGKQINSGFAYCEKCVDMIENKRFNHVKD